LPHAGLEEDQIAFCDSDYTPGRGSVWLNSVAALAPWTWAHIVARSLGKWSPCICRWRFLERLKTTALASESSQRI